MVMTKKNIPIVVLTAVVFHVSWDAISRMHKSRFIV